MSENIVEDKSKMSVPRSVISANVKLALRCRSTFSEYTRVLKERRGSPVKKSVSCRCGPCHHKLIQCKAVIHTFSRYCSKSATASLSLSASAGSYNPSLDLPERNSVSKLERIEDCVCLAPLQQEDPQWPMPQVECLTAPRARGFSFGQRLLVRFYFQMD